ncbi:MAG: transporter permease [Phycisphaerales bacterium]|jgi:sulfate/thiosulfate-binding protein|nr:transporter permease [Phycisphaerales bacterium]MDB5305783.1 transporter permease [Phycisphaerales bacterium]
MISLHRMILATAAAVASFTLAAAPSPVRGDDVKLLNVSYDPTRELYKDINTVFARQWKAQSGQNVVIDQSHGGSGKQSRAVLDGLEADVVTLGLGHDIDALKEGGLVAPEWQTRLPHGSTPFTSTIVFVVRKNNPKQIKDWPDLLHKGVQVIVPNPKTSGGARWAYLAAWGQAARRNNGGEAAARAYITDLFKHVPILDSGARGSTTTFVQRHQGDVLLAWENEALLTVNEFGKDKYQVVYPPISVLAEPPVSVVDKVVDKHGTRAVAEAYLKFLFTDEAQEIGAKNYYRPRSEAVAQKHADQFPKIETFTVNDIDAGGWSKIQPKHFSDGGVFDQIYSKK